MTVATAPGGLGIVRFTSIAALTAAVIAGLALGLSGRWAMGLALALGLALGAAGTFPLKRSADRGQELGVAGFTAVSMLRLVVMTVLAVGAGLLFLGRGQIWLILVGLGSVQVTLSLTATFYAMRGSR
ncbi:MAG: hypothetical protein ACYDAY_07105 [Candidatus Dormibacteria bacterium]